VPPGFENCITSREILNLKDKPDNLIIIGGGVIGLEFASYFNSVGARVTVFEMLDKIGGPIDGEIADILYKNYVKKGIEFKLGTRVSPGDFSPSDSVLIAIGRKPSTQNLGLENINVLTERGAIVTDEYGKTSAANVYAAGDVNGKSMLAHTAYREGEVCVNNIWGKKDKINYNSIPGVIYTNPEVGSVGETEKSAYNKGYDISVVKLPMNYSGRYLAENEKGGGICKLIADKKSRRIFGVHIIGSYASEIILAAGFLIEACVTVDRAKTMIFPHPTVGEIIREALFVLNI